MLYAFALAPFDFYSLIMYFSKMFNLSSSSGRKLYVAHYGHERLQGARHWALILMKNKSTGKAYQIQGSTSTYSYRAPDRHIKPFKSSTFMGMVEVGFIPNKRRNEFKQFLSIVPVIHGDLQWNCQNWIINVLDQLRGAEFKIQSFSHEDLLSKLEECKNELWH